MTTLDDTVAATRPQLVIFDLDGTLTDSAQGIVSSFRHALGEVGADLTEGVTEAGHNALRRIGQGAVEVEDHQLRPGRRDGVIQGRHASIVSDGALLS